MSIRVGWVVLSCVPLFYGCEARQESAARVQASELAKSEKSIDPQGEKAKALALSFVTENSLDWKGPATVTLEDDGYHVFYPTPQTELRMVGPRTLLVNTESGTVSPVPRR